MAKFCDKVGFTETSETAPGVWEDVITEVTLFGDILRNTMQVNETEMKVNSDISVGNSISVVANAYASEHFHAIRYVKWAGAYWIVSNVEVKSPRLILRLGGVYNGPKAPTPVPA